MSNLTRKPGRAQELTDAEEQQGSAPREGKQAEEKQFLLERLRLQVDLYKQYLDLIIKLNAFYYTATGAVLSFYIAQSNTPLVKYLLLIPIIMSLLFGALLSLAAYYLYHSQSAIEEMVIGLNLSGAPEAKILLAFLVISAALMFIVFASLLLFFTKA